MWMTCITQTTKRWSWVWLVRSLQVELYPLESVHRAYSRSVLTGIHVVFWMIFEVFFTAKKVLLSLFVLHHGANQPFQDAFLSCWSPGSRILEIKNSNSPCQMPRVPKNKNPDSIRFLEREVSIMQVDWAPAANVCVCVCVWLKK